MADKLVPDKEASLHSEIKKKIGSLMEAYSSEKTKTADPNEYELMFFLDGCFVLHFIFCIMFNQVKDLEIERCEIDAVHKDLFLMENQLPFELLKILSGNDPELLHIIDRYIYTHKISKDVDSVSGQDKPVHLLDRMRTIIIGGQSYTHKWQPAILGQWQWQSASTPSQPAETRSIVLQHAKELTTKGIYLERNRTGFLKDIFFRSHFFYGTLQLPMIIVDDSTRVLFLNLAAYEMCAGVGSTITSYICLLDSLVNQADDIKELQKAGVLINHIGTEEDAAKLFNEMSQGLHPDKDTYMDVKKKIRTFFEHKTKTSIACWVAEAYHNHFKQSDKVLRD